MEGVGQCQTPSFWIYRPVVPLFFSSIPFYEDYFEDHFLIISFNISRDMGFDI